MALSIVDQAIMDARAALLSGGSTFKTASAVPETMDAFLQDVNDTVHALEFTALKLADDGTKVGTYRTNAVEDFLKNASKGKPAESISPAGQQATAPSAGKKKLTPSPSVNGQPRESESLTGQQATIGQEPPEVASVPMETGKHASLYDLLMSGTKVAGKGGPAESAALHNQAAPPNKNENTNIHLLRSNTAPVAATKREAKAPTLARLRTLFANAGDTAPSHASAMAVAPKAYRMAGKIKEAAKELSEEDLKKSRRRAMIAGGLGGGFLGLAGGGALGGFGATDGSNRKNYTALGGAAGSLLGTYLLPVPLVGGAIGGAAGSYLGHREAELAEERKRGTDKKASDDEASRLARRAALLGPLGVPGGKGDRNAAFAGGLIGQQVGSVGGLGLGAAAGAGLGALAMRRRFSRLPMSARKDLVEIGRNLGNNLGRDPGKKTTRKMLGLMGAGLGGAVGIAPGSVAGAMAGNMIGAHHAVKKNVQRRTE